MVKNLSKVVQRIRSKGIECSLKEIRVTLSSAVQKINKRPIEGILND